MKLSLLGGVIDLAGLEICLVTTTGLEICLVTNAGLELCPASGKPAEGAAALAQVEDITGAWKLALLIEFEFWKTTGPTVIPFATSPPAFAFMG